MGNGETTEFNFNFPYYESTNIVVTKNNATATGYSIVGTSGGLDADIPYVGGKVVFETAPTSMDSITIARNLPLERAIDYQPTAKIDPTTLNQDMNYMLELLKDLQDKFDDLHAQYTEIADKDSTATLLSRIATVSEAISTISAQITALGDISTLRQSVTDLSTTVSGHTTNIGTLDTRTTGMTDYVIASQSPTAENDYIWYRKYKSGWVEQGGCVNTAQSGERTVNFPIEMMDANYTIVKTMSTNSSNANIPYNQISFYSKTATNAKTNTAGVGFSWMVSGIHAQ